jgi:tetrahydromethanopterin S-methyltransferase subunit G
MGRVTKKATIQSVTLKHINEKLDHIHKDLDQNTKDIVELKQRGGLKVIFYIGAIISIILGGLKIGKFI